MADWVECTEAGAPGRRVFINLDAAYSIRATNEGSNIQFLVSRDTEDGIRPVSYAVSESPEDIIVKLPVRRNA